MAFNDLEGHIIVENIVKILESQSHVVPESQSLFVRCRRINKIIICNKSYRFVYISFILYKSLLGIYHIHVGWMIDLYQLLLHYIEKENKKGSSALGSKVKYN